MNTPKKQAEKLLDKAGITINGKNDYDPQIHNEKLYQRVLSGGSLALGEAYMDSWWDVKNLDGLFYKILAARVQENFNFSWPVLLTYLKFKVFNLETPSKSFEVGQKHYDIGNNVYGAMLDKAYKKLVRPNIIQPTFLIDHPIRLSPLAKRHKDKPNRAERFQLVLGGGIELVNGFSELNDPLDQRSRFDEQERLRQAGDKEAQRIDEDFLECLEYGMPPAAGLGLGLDRLAALLTNNHSLKEVILFPTLRPKS